MDVDRRGPTALLLMVAAFAAADIGPFTRSKAEAVSRKFLAAVKLSAKEPCLYKANSHSGEHEFLFGKENGGYGGLARVSVCSWTGVLTSFTNQRSATARLKPLPKGRKRLVTTDAQAVRIALNWAARSGLHPSARIPRKPQFGKSPWVTVQVREKAPHGYEFLGGFPEYATLRIDVVDGALYKFLLYPRRVVQTWKLKVKPETLQKQAITEYRKGMLAIQEKPTAAPPTFEVGYTNDPVKGRLYDPSKGRRVHYKVLGVMFTFATSGMSGLKDRIVFDAGTGKLLNVWIAERHHHERMLLPKMKAPPKGPK
jgi:hypothetical protein